MNTVHLKQEVLLNPNRLVRHLGKPAHSFTKNDILRFIDDMNIELLNFKYVGEDGRLKTLNFVITSKRFADAILSTGERVDGSSLFSFLHADHSDLYVIPRFKTAFVDPFADIPTLNILCSFYTAEGKPLESAPEYILRKAHQHLKDKTGYSLWAMGELEYYVASTIDDLYPAPVQRGYHSSPPFTNWESMRIEAMQLIAQSGGKIKYGHSEVGYFSTKTHAYEQHEIEFEPVDVEDAIDQLTISKWIIRMLGQKYGLQISFAPKIAEGNAGSGLHIHLQLMKDGENQMIEKSALSKVARKMISGLLTYARPLTAFGNTIPTSYLRLVPNQEAPTRVCWGASNRSVLIRIPLGWVAETQMIKHANPQETDEIPYIPGKQTIEFRSPDGSADLYLLMAGMLLAITKGLEDEHSLTKALGLYVNVNISDEENKAVHDKLENLPASCWESALALAQFRALFETDNIFPSGTIDQHIVRLKSYKDRNLSERIRAKKVDMQKLVEKFIHCG